jgi:hypothetical protein
MEGGENQEPPRFCIEVKAPRGGRKLAVLWLHHGATIQSAIEAIVGLLDIRIIHPPIHLLSYVTIPNVTYHTNLSVLRLLCYVLSMRPDWSFFLLTCFGGDVISAT